MAEMMTEQIIHFSDSSDKEERYKEYLEFRKREADELLGYFNKLTVSGDWSDSDIITDALTTGAVRQL